VKERKKTEFAKRSKKKKRNRLSDKKCGREINKQKNRKKSI
jgi:hypothetical protein